MLSFIVIFATDTGVSKIPLHRLGGLETPKTPQDLLLSTCSGGCDCDISKVPVVVVVTVILVKYL